MTSDQPSPLATRSSPTLRLVRDGLSLAGLIVAAWFIAFPGLEGIGYDARAYWDLRLDDLYGASFDGSETFLAFRYSPPVGLLMAPLHLIPWPLFLAAWTIGLIGTLVWVAREWWLATFVLIGVAMSIYVGNIDLLIAASIVLGFRHPGWWAVGILTKVTPGVGLLWFAVRREWRRLAIALGVTAAIALPTVLLRPDLWSDYVAMITDNTRVEAGEAIVPLWLRGAIAAGMIAWAARTDRPWVVPLAVALVQPFFSLRTLTVAVAAIPLFRDRRVMTER